MQANFVLADIFRHEDANGKISFSDTPSHDATLIETKATSYRYKHQVKRVYDGDTIVLENDQRVRLLGINTPEIDSRYRQGEEGGQTAKQWLQTKLQQGFVFLEYDQLKKDKYKRALAHLFLDSGEHLNAEIVRAGLATLSIIPPNLRYIEQLQEAEDLASQQGLGIWGMASYSPISVEKLSKLKKTSGWKRFIASPKKLKLTRKYSRLILSDKVDLRIPKESLGLFPNLDSYIGKQLEIRGWASRSKGHYSILVRHPSAIIFL